MSNKKWNLLWVLFAQSRKGSGDPGDSSRKPLHSLCLWNKCTSGESNGDLPRTNFSECVRLVGAVDDEFLVAAYGRTARALNVSQDS